jgi:hypothetical protein
MNSFIISQLNDAKLEGSNHENISNSRFFLDKYGIVYHSVIETPNSEGVYEFDIIYKIIDISKFHLLLLEYPEYIKEIISYE